MTIKNIHQQTRNRTQTALLAVRKKITDVIIPLRLPIYRLLLVDEAIGAGGRRMRCTTPNTIIATKFNRENASTV